MTAHSPDDRDNGSPENAGDAADASSLSAERQNVAPQVEAERIETVPMTTARSRKRRLDERSSFVRPATHHTKESDMPRPCPRRRVANGTPEAATVAETAPVAIYQWRGPGEGEHPASARQARIRSSLASHPARSDILRITESTPHAFTPARLIDGLTGIRRHRRQRGKPPHSPFQAATSLRKESNDAALDRRRRTPVLLHRNAGGPAGAQTPGRTA